MQVSRPDMGGNFPRLENGVHDVALGNGTLLEMLVFKSRGVLNLGVFGHGCYKFSSFVSAGFASEKLFSGGGLADAAHVADFINCQLQVFDGEPQGKYFKEHALPESQSPT